MQTHSQSTILNTRENLQAVVEMFAEHVEFCAEPFKEEILKKVNELKGRDAKLLTSFVWISFALISLDWRAEIVREHWITTNESSLHGEEVQR